MDTYCGKNCEFCNEKESGSCPGCRVGPGRSLYSGCEIADCCRSKGHENCKTCTLKPGCGKQGRRESMPGERRRKAAAEAARKAEIARRAPVLGRWLWVLFWLIVPSVLVGLLTNDTLVGMVPALKVPGRILSVLVSVAYGLVLLRLSSEEKNYRTAGGCTLLVAAIDLVAVFIPDSRVGLSLLLALVGILAGLTGEYLECMGHSEVLREMDEAFARKWKELWKWYIIAMASIAGGVILSFLFSLLGSLVVLAAAIVLVVVSIKKLVCLYRMAKMFREYDRSETT